MTRLSQHLLLALGALLVLVGANYDILRKQGVVDEGAQILLPIRPTDPRSLLQGDYMSLRYAHTALPPDSLTASLPRRGSVVVRLDADGVAAFARLDDGAPLAAGELRLRYKRRFYEQEVSYGADAFYFQEGRADLYAKAKFGVLRVDGEGNSILVGLADEDHKMLTVR